MRTSPTAFPTPTRSLAHAKCVLTYALMALVTQASAQTACTERIAGTVLDEHDAEVLLGATVFLTGAQRGVATDPTGAFELEGLCVGADTLRVSHVGCETVYVPVRIGSASAKTLRVELEHHTELLDGIEVHAHRNQTSAADIGATLSGEQLDRTAGGDFAAVVEALPGVRSVASGANVGRPLVDGLGGARLQVVQGGTALATQDWGDEHALEIDPFATANVQLARAGGTVRYGRSTTGASIVLDDARMPVERELSGQALLLGATNAGTVGAGAAVTQRIRPRVGYRAQAFGSASGDARAPDYVLSNTGARRASGSVRMYYADTSLSFDVGYRAFHQEAGILRAAHVGNLTDLERAIASGEPLVIRPFGYGIDAPRQVANHHWTTANAAYRLPDDTQLSLSYSLQFNQRREFDVRRGGRSAVPALNLELTTGELRAEYAHAPLGKWTGRVGVTAVDAQNRNRETEGVAPFIPYYDAQSLGLFAEERRVGDHYTWELAGRIDGQQFVSARRERVETGGSRVVEWDTLNVTGTLALGLTRYGEGGSSVRARVVYASRVPSPAERFADGLHHALATIEVGDTSLAVEHGVKAVVGYGFEDAERAVGLHVSGFVHGFRDYVYQRQRELPALTIRGAFPVLLYEQADAVLAGLDVDAHVPLGPLRIDVESSYLYGRLSGGEPLPDVAPWRTRGELSYSEARPGRLKDWRFGVSLQHVARQSRVPDNLLAPAPEAYALLGAELRAHVAVGERVLGVHLSGHNLLDARYRSYLDRLRYYADRPGADVQLRLLYDF